MFGHNLAAAKIPFCCRWRKQRKRTPHNSLRVLGGLHRPFFILRSGIVTTIGKNF